MTGAWQTADHRDIATTAKRESLRIARGGAWTVPMDHAGLLDFAQAEEASPEQAVLQAEQARLDAQRARRLWRAFSELSARCQQLLRVLIATPPRTYAEVAAALGMPVGSIGPIHINKGEKRREGGRARRV